MPEKLILANFRRYLWEKKDLIVVIGELEPLVKSRQIYHQRHKIELPNQALNPTITRLLGAAGLASISLADKESWGWTFSLPNVPYGFFCAAEPEGMLSVRINDADIEANGVVVQRQKGESPIFQSHLEAVSTDPVNVVEAYFKEVDQIETRIEISNNNQCVLVQSLPGGDFDAVKSLSSEELVTTLTTMVNNQELKGMHEAVLYYECRCDQERINTMLDSLPSEKQQELWKDTNHLEIECPRCGREYNVRKLH